MAELNEEVTQDLAEQFETTPEIIKEAHDMGWVAPDDFKGDEENFRKPDDFVKRGKEILGIVNKRNEELRRELRETNERFGAVESKLKATEAQIKEKDRVMKKVLDIHDNISQREYDRALATIRQQQKEAINNQDGAKWEELEQEKDALEKPEKIELKPDGDDTTTDADNTDEPPEFVEWKGENSWFGTDTELTAYAGSIEQFLIGQGFSGKVLLDKITEEVKTRFPNKFTNPNRETSDLDATDTNPGGAGLKKNKTYNDLPADAKAACDKCIKQGLIKDKKEYVRDYFEEE